MSQWDFGGAVFAIVLVEMFLAATWNRTYFIWGFPIYRRTVSLPFVAGSVRLAQALEEKTARRWWSRLTFKPISDAECAFRESYASALHIGRVPYAPIMRGLVSCRRESREVTVTGLCNWYVAGAIVFVVVPAVEHDVVFLPLFIALLGGSYVVQVIRFNHVWAALQDVAPSNSALERAREE